MIDFHTHIGRLNISLKPLTTEILISSMDRLGIEKAIVLPIENPEEVHFYSTTDYVLSECSKYSKRLIPFCCLDPRRGVPSEFATNVPLLTLKPHLIIEEYVNRGCKGFGECLQGLPINDPRASRLYDVCGDLGLPVVLHIMYNFINYDEVGLPGLEKLLKRHKDTTFVAHANGWWSEISANVDPTITYSYPTGKVKTGRASELLENYDNLYADISAQSGYNALTRDPDFGIEFLEQHSNKLLFGTDYLHDGQELPIVDFIKSASISRKTFRAITRENAEKLLNLTS